MSPEFWEFLDTVAKLTLSALIAGVVTFRITALKHRQTVEEATVRRRMELIEEITAGVAKFSNSVIRFLTLTGNIQEAVYRHDSTIGEAPKEWVDERNRLSKELMDGAAMEKPEGLLYLVSADGKLPSALFDLQRMAEDALNYAAQEDLFNVDHDELMAKQERLKKQAAYLVAELGNVYRKPSL